MVEEAVAYSHFMRKISDGSHVRLRLQEMRKCDVDNVTNFLMQWYLEEEPYHEAAGIKKSPEALAEYRQQCHDRFTDGNNHTLICCIDDEKEPPDIVGCNALEIMKRGSLNINKGHTPELASFSKIITELRKIINITEKENVEKFLIGKGMSVHPLYRGCGIATEMLRARQQIMQIYNIPCTGAWFTSRAAQKAAEKCDYDQVAEVTSVELGRLANVEFNDPTTFKFMVLRRLSN